MALQSLADASNVLKALGMKPKIILIGSGGHAKVLVEALSAANTPLDGLTEIDMEIERPALRDIPVLGTDECILEFAPDDVILINGLGTSDGTGPRRRVFESFRDRGYRFQTIIHPAAVTASDVELADGVQIMAGAIIQPSVVVGCNAIINTRASIDHDCRIGRHCHIAPGATVCGYVAIGPGTMVGAGAVISDRISVGADCFIGAGAVVTRDVPDGVQAKGVPARW